MQLKAFRVYLFVLYNTIMLYNTIAQSMSFCCSSVPHPTIANLMQTIKIISCWFYNLFSPFCCVPIYLALKIYIFSFFNVICSYLLSTCANKHILKIDKICVIALIEKYSVFHMVTQILEEQTPFIPENT